MEDDADEDDDNDDDRLDDNSIVLLPVAPTRFVEVET